MSWQDELQQLDNALAGGRISADEYRQRRDHLLAQASGQPAAQPQQPTGHTPPGGQPQQQLPPQQQPGQQQPGQQQPGQQGQQQGQPGMQGGNPFPPAFSWQQDAQNATQVMRAVGDPAASAPNAADRTQVVRGDQAGGGDADRTQVVPGQSASGGDRTQVVHGMGNQQGPQGPGTPPPGFPPPPANPWSSQPPQQGGDSAPPWGAGGDMPSNFGSANWLRQGPEVFDESSSGGRSKIVIITLAVVVLLVIGGGIYYFATKSGSKPEAQQQHQTATTTTPPPSPTPTGPNLPDGPFVAFPGTPTAEQGGQNISIATAVQAQVPSQQEAPILKADGVTSIGFLITKDEQDPQLIRGLWSFTPSAGTSLPTLLEKIDQEFANAGYQQMPGLPAGVVGLTVPPGPQQTGGVYRAHYITQGVIVRVEAYGPDADAAKQAFDDLLQKELDKFPPTS